jgi:type II restriction enzyme
MALTNTQKLQIQQVIANCLRNKFQNYEAKDNFMPFHFRLLGKDRLALYSFMQSLLTTFGTSIFEPVPQRWQKRNLQTLKRSMS